jgi:hypothetical protein
LGQQLYPKFLLLWHPLLLVLFSSWAGPLIYLLKVFTGPFNNQDCSLWLLYGQMFSTSDCQGYHSPGNLKCCLSALEALCLHLPLLPTTCFFSLSSLEHL